MYLHSLGIIHRDLKPENILLMYDGTVKIADFGLAPQGHANFMATECCGSPLFVAPEILRLVPYSFSCDIWSIGVLTYLLISGNVPFHDSDKTKLYKKIQLGVFVYDTPVWTTVNLEVVDLINQMLIVDPKKRISAYQIH